MIRHSSVGRSSRHGGNPVAAVLSRLSAVNNLPSVGNLAAGIIGGFGNLPGVQEAAVLFEPGLATGLDSGWGRHPENCLVCWDRGAQARWVKAPQSWRAGLLAAMGQAYGPGVVQGHGLLPGTTPWPARAGARDDQWLAGWLSLRGEPLAVILLVLDGESEEIAAAAAGLHDLQAILEPVLGIWAEASAIRSRLRQSATETRALGRINQLQGRFVAMATHEFKTPLTSIMAYADVLIGQITDEQFPHATEFLGVIRTEAARLLRMINRILDFSRLEYGSHLLDLRSLDLEPLVRETVRSLQPGIQDKRLTVTVTSQRRLPKAEIDADLIRQVLVNLIGNAVKYTPAGGRIDLDLAEEASTVSVKVSDDGPGIAPEDIRRIFRGFYRARGTAALQDGTGLGLTIAKHIVNLHGGHIDAARRPAGGSEFTFLLPKAADLLGGVPPHLTKNCDEQAARRLLVAILRLSAELTGARTSALLLRTGQGDLAPVCGLGLELDLADAKPVSETPVWSRFLEQGDPVTDTGPQAAALTADLPWLMKRAPACGGWLLAPLGGQHKALGCLLLGCRREPAAFGAADLAQVRVLAGIVRTALGNLNLEPDKTAEAVRALIQVRRNGVPTAEPEALQLVRDLATRLQAPEEAIVRMQWAAVLHDAGMTRIEDEIVRGPALLSYDEKDEVDGHVEHGLELIQPLLPDAEVAGIIKHHHERVDGSGHPAGLRGGEIPLGSRVLAVVDAWFSLTRDRPYRRGLSPQDALLEVAANAGSQFDPLVTAALQQSVLGEESCVAGPTAPGAGITGRKE